MADLIVKSNKLVHAIQSLTLSETRLIQLAIIDARETGQGLTPEHPLELNAERYAKAFNVSLDAAYLSLCEAEKTLFRRQFTIENDDGTLTKSRWIQDANYRKGEGRILLTLTRVLIEQVTKIDGFATYFTSYHLKQTANFKSVYAIRLYELLRQWKSCNVTPVFQLEKFREQLGIGVNEYSRVEAFKRRVVDVALQQINEFSDIKAEYTQHKKGRSISGFSFTFELKGEKKPSPEINLSKLHKAMTEPQRFLFANKLAELPDISKLSSAGESYQQFAIRLAEMLKEEDKFIEFYPHLKKVGYQPSKQ